ncbi:hypothetical protein BDZ94DRAFT_1273729 [Collybia nuda]|uniref:DUF6534 domain-containing protein n=1 Tax=Collybia nuda TaxID=64659 RepID=A0A9P5XTE9_9AGAR|nr:hypothetical protein BDZ94DRAFT_1273729 [Collybia nuda]
MSSSFAISIMSLSVPKDIALLSGPLYWGNLFAYGLYGILIVQIFIYYHRFRRDPPRIKALVWILFVLETLITVLGTIAGGKIIVSGWGNPAALAHLDWALSGTPLLSGLVASSVHFFYCWRIHRLRQLTFIPIILMIMSLLTTSMAAFCGIHGHQLGIFRLRELRPYALIWIVGSTLVDASITACMVTILLQARSKSNFERTTSLIQKLIALTVETAMPTGAAGLVHAVLYLTYPTNNLHFLTFLMLAKFYSNSLLATLNARALIGEHDNLSVPAFWADTSVSPSQQIPHNHHLSFVHTMHDLGSAATQASQATNHGGVETIPFAPSLSKNKEVP